MQHRKSRGSGGRGIFQLRKAALVVVVEEPKLARLGTGFEQRRELRPFRVGERAIQRGVEQAMPSVVSRVVHDAAPAIRRCTHSASARRMKLSWL